MGMALLLTGCAGGGGADEIEEAEKQVFVPEEYTAEQMLEDYDFIWTVLEENCGLLDLYDRTHDQSAGQIKEKYRQKVQKLADGDAEGFYQVIFELSGAGFRGGFGHITSINAANYFSVCSRESFESDTQRACFLQPQVRAYYEWEKTLKTEQALMRQDGRTDAAGPAGADSWIKQNIQTDRVEGTPVIAVRSFQYTGGDNGAITKVLNNWCLENLDAKAVIIDIRGNTGGSTELWQQGFAPLFAGRKLEMQTIAAYKDTVFNRAMWGGWPQDDGETKVLPIHEVGSIGGFEPDALKPGDYKNLDKVAVKTAVIDYSDGRNPGGKRYEGRIYLLIDQQNFSAAEAMVLALQGEPNVITVGLPTAGNGAIITSPAKNVCIMPNSGRLFQFVPFYYFNPDGSCNEERGTAPMIMADNGQDALEVSLAQIAAMQ